MTSSKFTPEQAVEIRNALKKHGVEYLFIGKSGAILLGYPDTTQDVDIYAPKNEENGRKLVAALKETGFTFEEEVEAATISGKDFIQLKTGPFDLDIIHAPDGIESFQEAKQRSVITPEGFPVTSLSDIINSKKAAGRAKDTRDIPFLENFKEEYLKRNPKPLRSSHEILKTTLKKDPEVGMG